jgi:hypothetical protein
LTQPGASSGVGVTTEFGPERLRTCIRAVNGMNRFRYYHRLLFVCPDGPPITERLPEGHEGRATWGVVPGPTPDSGRESGR